MTTIDALFAICIVIGGGILIWFQTKSGKKWLRDL